MRVGETPSGTLGCSARSGEDSKAPPSPPPPKTTVPQAWSQAGAAVPTQPGAPEGPGPAARPRAGKGELSRPNKAPGTHSSRRGRTKGAFGAAEATRPLPAPGGQSAATAASAPAWVGAQARSRDLAHPSPQALVPGTPRGPQVPHPPAAPPDAPTSAGSQQWALPRRPPRPREGARQAVPGPGARDAAAPARPPASHHPPAARRQRGRHLENRAYFSRACPSEGTAEPLPLANMFCREEGAEPRRRRRRRRYRSGCSRAAPSLPAPSPALARSLARAFLAALPSLPPRRWLRALSSCQSVSPGRGPIALELLPRRLGLGCRCRRRRRRRSPVGPAARWLARAPPARLRLRRPLRLQHRCRRRRCRWSTWSSTERGYPGEGARRASTSRD